MDKIQKYIAMSIALILFIAMILEN